MWRQAASQGGVGWMGAMERRKGRVTWPAPRAQATSFHSLSLSLCSCSSPFSVFLSIPHRHRRTPGLASAPPPALPRRPRLGRSTMARWSPASLRRQTATLSAQGTVVPGSPFSTKHRISQPPGQTGLPLDHTCPLFSPLQTPGNLFSNINIRR